MRRILRRRTPRPRREHMSTPKLLVVALAPALVFVVLLFWWRLALQNGFRDDALRRMGELFETGNGR